MAPKKNVRDAAPAADVTASSAPAKTTKASAPSKQAFEPVELAQKMWNHYVKTTGHQARLVDAFLVFLMVVGALQALYYFLIARDPFNAFLAGFIATVGQFVLTVSLRMQTDEQNKSDFPKVTPERAMADYIFGSLILHFFCVNYIN